LIISFSDAGLHRLCCVRSELDGRSGSSAEWLARLLNELACAETLALLDTLPYVEVKVRRAVAVVNCDEVKLLLVFGRGKSAANPLSAKSARLVAVALDGEDINPEGVKWPR
jgi:hypothetical protein